MSVWDSFSPVYPLAQNKPPCPVGFSAGMGLLVIGLSLVQDAFPAHNRLSHCWAPLRAHPLLNPGSHSPMPAIPMHPNQLLQPQVLSLGHVFSWTRSSSSSSPNSSPPPPFSPLPSPPPLTSSFLPAFHRDKEQKCYLIRHIYYLQLNTINMQVGTFQLETKHYLYIGSSEILYSAIYNGQLVLTY